MKNIFKSALSLTVAIGLAVVPMDLSWAISEQDTYVALGDSISTGYGLEDIENNLFVNKIKKEYNLNLDNKAVDGMDTTAMLDLLNSNDEKGIAYKNAIKDAELITISMGGNNLLQPLMEMMKKGLGLDSNATGIELQEAMKKNPELAKSFLAGIENGSIKYSDYKDINEMIDSAEKIINDVYNNKIGVEDGTSKFNKCISDFNAKLKPGKEFLETVAGIGVATVTILGLKNSIMKLTVDAGKNRKKIDNMKAHTLKDLEDDNVEASKMHTIASWRYTVLQKSVAEHSKIMKLAYGLAAKVSNIDMPGGKNRKSITSLNDNDRTKITGYPDPDAADRSLHAGDKSPDDSKKTNNS